MYGGTGGVIAQMFFDVKPDTKELVITGRPDKRYFYFTCALKSVYCGVNRCCRWSWVHVDDLGEAYVRVAKAGSVADHQIFNISAQGEKECVYSGVWCCAGVGATSVVSMLIFFTN